MCIYTRNTFYSQLCKLFAERIINIENVMYLLEFDPGKKLFVIPKNFLFDHVFAIALTMLYVIYG